MYRNVGVLPVCQNNGHFSFEIERTISLDVGEVNVQSWNRTLAPSQHHHRAIGEVCVREGHQAALPMAHDHPPCM